MDAERWQRVEQLFHCALELADRDRTELLERECSGDHALRVEVERMIRQDTEGADIFDRVRDDAGGQAPDPVIGQTLGNYLLTSRLGEGGMAVVYRARRADGLFDQEVAVKLIRVGRATGEMIKRFEFERSTLAGLSHPNIARLYDGGTSEKGVPYIVMELIPGAPIDAFCDGRQLSIEARLRLFITVCHAVHFAHQNLIIHRDIKPGNILIDEHGVPKLLDFGIARLAEDEDARTAAPTTQTMSRVLTPEYASPEQLTGGPVTTAIDVYALGVVLYDLLTGVRPFHCDSRSPIEWHRMVIEQTPRRPSTAVLRADSSATSARAGTAGHLRRKLRGDLDRIVMMALRKEPERRFQSVQEFADDIDRYLEGKPVHASEDSLLYRTGKFVRRNRIGVVAGVVAVLALGTSLVAARRSEQRAEEGERHAKEQALHARVEADSSRGIARFLMEAFLTSDGTRDDEADVEIRRLQIEEYAERVRRQHPNELHLRANLLDALNLVSLQLGLPELALELAQEALGVRESTFGHESLEVALSRTSVGRIHFARGTYAAAAEQFQRALELHRSCPPGPHTDVATAGNDLAVALRHLGRGEEALDLHREALELRRRGGGETLPVAEALNNMAAIQLHRGEFAAATESLSEALEIRRDVLGGEHALALQTQANLSIAVWGSGDRDAAKQLMWEAVEGLRGLRFGAREDLERGLVNLSQFHVTVGELEQAGPLLEEAVELTRERLGPDHPDVAATQQKLAVLMQRRGHHVEAAALWDEVIALHRRGTMTAPILGRCLSEYGLFLFDTGEVNGAEEALREAVEVLGPLEQGDPVALGRAEVALGYVLMRTGRANEAESRMVAGIALLDRAPAAADRDLATARGYLAKLRSGAGD